MSRKSMEIMNSLITDLLERIAVESRWIISIGNAKTVSGRVIQAAVRLVLPGELAKHAVSEGVKASMGGCGCGCRGVRPAKGTGTALE